MLLELLRMLHAASPGHLPRSVDSNAGDGSAKEKSTPRPEAGWTGWTLHHLTPNIEKGLQMDTTGIVHAISQRIGPIGEYS